MWSCFKSQSTNPDRPIVKSNILVVQVYCTPGSINNVITALNKHCSKRASKIYDGGNSSKTENRWMLYGQLGSRGLQNYQSCLNDVVKVTGVSRAAIQTNDFDIYRMYAPAQLTKAENKGVICHPELNLSSWIMDPVFNQRKFHRSQSCGGPCLPEMARTSASNIEKEQSDLACISLHQSDPYTCAHPRSMALSCNG